MGCGSSFSAKAPDDVHKFSSVYQCWYFDWTERGHKCFSCSKMTTLYLTPKSTDTGLDDGGTGKQKDEQWKIR